MREHGQLGMKVPRGPGRISLPPLSPHRAPRTPPECTAPQQVLVVKRGTKAPLSPGGTLLHPLSSHFAWSGINATTSIDNRHLTSENETRALGRQRAALGRREGVAAALSGRGKQRRAGQMG